MFLAHFISTLLTIILFAVNNLICSEILLAFTVTSMTSFAFHFDIKLILLPYSKKK